METIPDACDVCDRLACVCPTKKAHHKDCKFRIAVTCAVGIECEHGYDVCPQCDPCTCEEEETKNVDDDGGDGVLSDRDDGRYAMRVSKRALKSSRKAVR